jgi:DNA repair protein RadC
MEISNEQQWNAAEVELVYKTTVKASDRPKISHSKDSVEVFRRTWNEPTIELFEEFKILLTNRANQVLGICQISKGGLTATVADPKLIFAYALKPVLAGSYSLIITLREISHQASRTLTSQLK